MSIIMLNNRYNINLEQLSLSERKLTSLPEEIANFINLQDLD